MLRQPIDIKPGTIFISGAYTNSTGMENRKPFFDLESKLRERGYTVFNPLNNMHSKGANNRLAFLVMCDRVVTIAGWELDVHAQTEVRVARIMGKEILIGETFERWDTVRKDAHVAG